VEAIIIAAGEGSRLRPEGARRAYHPPKPLTPLLGLALIERALLSLRDNGIRDIIIVIGHRGEEIRERLGDGRRYGVRLRFVENRRWRQGNGGSVLAARKALAGDSPFLLAMSDHVAEPGLLGRLLAAGQPRPGEVYLAVDFDRQKVYQPEEATRVVVEAGEVREIGKGLAPYHGVDCGFFLCTDAIFDALAEEAAAGRHALTDGIRALARLGRVKAIDIGDAQWVDVDDAPALREARRRLLRGLPSARDGLISRLVNRRVSVPLSGALAALPISPNAVSVTSFLVAVAAALGFAQGSWLAAGLLAQAASILDGVDGEIARLKFQASRYGAYFDAILDRYADGLIILGMTYGWYATSPEPWVWLLGALALIGSPMSMLAKEKFQALTGSPYLPERFDGHLRYLPANRDGRLFLVMLAGLTGQIPAVLGLLALMSNVLALGRLWLVRRHLEG